MSSSRQFAQHVRVSSTEELSYTSASGNGEINDTIQTIVTGRKCWKTMKGKGEVVWPPYLEAALVEGLEKYQPVESRTTRAFGRFPMRNKFISDYIYNATGKRRTPKQVGSRLQQLRDTTEGKRILQLLSSRHLALMQPSKGEPRAGSAPAPASSSPSPPSAPPCSYVSIDVAPDSSSSNSSSSSAPYSPGLSPLFPALDPSSSTSSAAAFHSAGPRALRTIDPTVTFMSRALLQAYSSFRVLDVRRGGKDVVHRERTELDLRSSSCLPSPGWASQLDTSYLYSTPFVPGFWNHLCDCGNPAAYEVVQDIVRMPHAGQASNAEEVLLSVVYQFNVSSASSPPHSPTTSSNGVDADSMSYSGESSSDFGSDFGDLLLYNTLDGSTATTAAPASAASIAVGGGGGALRSAASTTSSPSPASVGYATLDAHTTPGLIHRDEEGYASVPPSPLDLTFPGAVHDPASMPLHAGASAMCGGYMGYPAGPAVYEGAHAHAHLSQYTFDPFHA